jgi:hypothetical protein
MKHHFKVKKLYNIELYLCVACTIKFCARKYVLNLTEAQQHRINHKSEICKHDLEHRKWCQ